MNKIESIISPKSIAVVGATNRPASVEPASLHPGLGKRLLNMKGTEKRPAKIAPTICFS